MKFLVVRFSSLGDIITTTAFLSVLKDRYKEAEIYYATKEEFVEILQDQPFIDRVVGLKNKESIIQFSKRFKNDTFDCVFDLHKNPRSIALSYLVKTKSIKRVNKHTLYRYKLMHKRLLFFVNNRETEYNIDDQLRLITDDVKDKKPVLYVQKAKIKSKKTIIGIAPGARWKTKMWPKQYFKELVGMILNNMDCEVFIFGSENELSVANYIENGYKNVVNFVGKLSVKKTAEYMACCSVVVSNDSALMHMAVALNIPVVAIFGPTVEEFGFYPKTKKSIIFEIPGLGCRPCSLHGSDKCPLDNNRCMKDITVERVFGGVKSLLEVE